MQTRIFAGNLDRLVAGLQLQALDQALEVIFSGPAHIVITPQQKAEFSRLIFGVQVFASSLSDRQKSFANELGLGALFDQPLLARLLTLFQNASHRIQVQGEHVFWELYHLSRATLLLNGSIQENLVLSKQQLIAGKTAIIVLEMYDYHDEGLEVQRVADVLRTIALLYSSVDQYLETDSTPRLSFVDSGSNISFGIEGAAEVIAAITDMFSRAWNALRYRKNADIERNLATAMRGLDFLTALRLQPEAAVIDTETRAKLEYSVSQQIVSLIGAGVMIEGVQQTDTVDRTELMLEARSMKLLTPGESTPEV